MHSFSGSFKLNFKLVVFGFKFTVIQCNMESKLTNSQVHSCGQMPVLFIYLGVRWRTNPEKY